MRAVRFLRRIGRHTLAAMLAPSLVVWSVAPGADHAAAVFETLRDHAEAVAEHGHAHGFEEDLFAALHGHGHDAADHDHSEVMPTLDEGPDRSAAHGQARRLPSTRAGPARLARIDRPPRA